MTDAAHASASPPLGHGRRGYGRTVGLLFLRPGATAVAGALLAVGLVVAAAGCSRSSPESAPPAAKHFGDIMAEVGRRFERAGRAVAAGRWELADYDVGEIDEVFAQDIPAAIMPQDVHIDLRPIAQAFARTVPSDLRTAIAARDRAAFDSAFARGAASCNGCHQASGRAFIDVPTTIAVPVPRLDALAP